MLIGLLKMMTGHSGAKFEPVRVSDFVSFSHSDIRLAPPRRTQTCTLRDKGGNTNRRPWDWDPGQGMLYIVWFTKLLIVTSCSTGARSPRISENTVPIQ